MVVADFKNECILGTDFLTPHECVVDFKDNVLFINGVQVPLQTPRQVAIPTCCRLVLENVDLPPLSDIVLKNFFKGFSIYSRVLPRELICWLFPWSLWSPGPASPLASVTSVSNFVQLR